MFATDPLVGPEFARKGSSAYIDGATPQQQRTLVLGYWMRFLTDLEDWYIVGKDWPSWIARVIHGKNAPALVGRSKRKQRRFAKNKQLVGGVLATLRVGNEVPRDRYHFPPEEVPYEDQNPGTEAYYKRRSGPLGETSTGVASIVEI